MLRRGVPAESNAQLVRRLVEAAALVDRGPVGPRAGDRDPLPGELVKVDGSVLLVRGPTVG